MLPVEVDHSPQLAARFRGYEVIRTKAQISCGHQTRMTAFDVSLDMPRLLGLVCGSNTILTQAPLWDWGLKCLDPSAHFVLEVEPHRI